jgi:perosamine synthetase
MHAYGHPAELQQAQHLCQKYNLAMIEDAAEALGSYYKSTHVGTSGRFGVLSFNGNKIMTTGGGGMILCNSDEDAAQARHLTTTAKKPHAWRFDHDCIGYNYRMPNLNAAVGVGQLENIDRALADKRELAHRYAVAFSELDGVEFIEEPASTQSNYWLNNIRIAGMDEQSKSALIESLIGKNIHVRGTWTLMHKLPMFQHCPAMDLDVANKLEHEIISLPSSASLINH